MDNKSFDEKAKQQIKKISVQLYTSRTEDPENVEIKNNGFVTRETTLLSLKIFVGVKLNKNPEWMYVTDISNKPLQTYLSSNDIFHKLSSKNIEE